MSNEVELNILANKKCQFNIGEFFSRITTNLGIEHKNLSKLLKRHGWQVPPHTYPWPRKIIFTVEPLQRGGSNLGDNNYSSSSSAYSIEAPKVSNESCLLWITTRKYEASMVDYIEGDIFYKTNAHMAHKL